MHKAQYTKTDLIKVLRAKGYEPTIFEKVSSLVDVYTKKGKPQISLPKKNIIQYTELSNEMKKLID